MFSEIDIEKWARRATYEYFKDFEDPFFNITAFLNAGKLYRFCKKENLSFALSNLYCSLLAANEIDELKIRIADGKLIKFDNIHATQTILNEDESFSFCYFEMMPDIYLFDKAGRESIEKYGKLKTFDVESDRLDLIYYSVIPWVSFTSFKHASRFDNKQSVPRMVFGKMDESFKIPLSVEVHHAIADGIHVGRFFNLLQDKFDSFG